MGPLDAKYGRITMCYKHSSRGKENYWEQYARHSAALFRRSSVDP